MPTSGAPGTAQAGRHAAGSKNSEARAYPPFQHAGCTHNLCMPFAAGTDSRPPAALLSKCRTQPGLTLTTAQNLPQQAEQSLLGTPSRHIMRQQQTPQRSASHATARIPNSSQASRTRALLLQPSTAGCGCQWYSHSYAKTTSKHHLIQSPTQSCCARPLLADTHIHKPCHCPHKALHCCCAAAAAAAAALCLSRLRQKLFIACRWIARSICCLRLMRRC